MVEDDQVIEVNLKKGFPLLWLNFQKLSLLANYKVTILLKFKKDLIFTGDKLFIVDTRSSLKRAGGKFFNSQAKGIF